MCSSLLIDIIIIIIIIIIVVIIIIIVISKGFLTLTTVKVTEKKWRNYEYRI